MIQCETCEDWFHVNDHLLAFERSIDDSPDNVDILAKTIMVFMVCGIFTKLHFPYAQFPCASVTSDLPLSSLLDGCVEIREDGVQGMYYQTAIVIFYRCWLPPLMALR